MDLDFKDPKSASVIYGHKICQTREAKWLCLDNIYQKLYRPNFYDIGGTYIQDVADYWFMFKTEQISQIFLLHLFVCNRQEGFINIAVSRSAEIMEVDKKNDVVYLAHTMTEFRFKKTKEMSQNYLVTYNFTSHDIDFMKDRKLYIAVSFDCSEIRGMQISLVEKVKLKHDYSALMNDPIGSDFTIESSDGAQLKVHKVLLAAHSEVFKAMLKEETAECQNSFVKLVDVAKEELQYIVEFIYTGTVAKLNNCNFTTMLMLADKYNIKGLSDLSQYALSRQIYVDNVLEILIVADMYNAVFLKLAALKFIKNNTSVIHSSTFKEVKNPELMQELCEYMIPA